MNYTEKYFLHILKCFFLNRECDEPTSLLDMEKLYNLACNHDVQGIVFSKIKNFSRLKTHKYYNSLRQDFFALTMNSVTMEQNLNYLTALLNKKGYKHILFKGSVVKNFYPSKELRTMGDIDILVDDKDFDAIHKLIVNKGFVYDEATSERYTKSFNYKDTHFEIHTKIANKNSFIHSGDFVSFFSDAFNHSVKIKDNTYTLEATYHLVFLLYHFERHFEESGCGIRMLLDFPFFMRENKINSHKLEEYLSQLQLTHFCSSVFDLSNKYIGSDLPVITNQSYDRDISEFFIKKILDGGSFGHILGNKDCRKLFWVQLKYGYNPQSKSGKIKGYIRWLFPERKSLYGKGLCTEETPAIKMPAVYIKRIIRAVKKRKGLKNSINIEATSSDDYKYFTLINKMGIRPK